jgi:hypothetical protein
MTPH